MTTRTRYLPEFPSPTNLLAMLFGVVLLLVLIKYFVTDTEMPMLMPLATAALSATCLALIGARRNPSQSFMRAGFHLGTFAFFLFYPLMEPEAIGPMVSDGVRTIIGSCLLLTVVGFELAYWGTRLATPWPGNRPTVFQIQKKHRRVLLALVYFGVFGWFLTVLDVAISAGASVFDVLFSMRAAVEGERYEFNTYLSGGFVILHRILAGGALLGATAGSVLLLTTEEKSRAIRWSCWGTMIVCATTGFLSGSRAVFFYSFTPVIVTTWLKLSRSPRQRSMRWAWASGVVLLLIACWGAMSALRGSDIREYEGGIEAFSPALHVQGALDVYSQMGIVVQAFPELVPYQQGKSLLPLVLGWIPRALWADKPYPFGLFINFLNGESLESRSASIAVGLIGEGYGNFGLFGVFLWSVLMGFACRRGDDYIGNFHRDHPLRLHIGAMSAIWAALIVRGGVPEMFYMGLGVVMLPWGVAWYLFRVEKPFRTSLPVYSPSRPLHAPIGAPPHVS